MQNRHANQPKGKVRPPCPMPHCGMGTVNFVKGVQTLWSGSRGSNRHRQRERCLSGPASAGVGQPYPAQSVRLRHATRGRGHFLLARPQAYHVETSIWPNSLGTPSLQPRLPGQGTALSGFLPSGRIRKQYQGTAAPHLTSVVTWLYRRLTRDVTLTVRT
jgi:hypothetical protein